MQLYSAITCVVTSQKETMSGFNIITSTNENVSLLKAKRDGKATSG